MTDRETPSATAGMDIVERLRTTSPLDKSATIDVTMDAAREIESLRAMLRSLVSTPTKEASADRLNGIARYMESLENFSDAEFLRALAKRSSERDTAIHEHDCPIFKEFYKRHALGSKLCPSCLLCGQQRDREDWAITHGELPDIYICKVCVDAARSAPPTTAASGAKPLEEYDTPICDKWKVSTGFSPLVTGVYLEIHRARDLERQLAAMTDARDYEKAAHQRTIDYHASRSTLALPSDVMDVLRLCATYTDAMTTRYVTHKEYKDVRAALDAVIAKYATSSAREDSTATKRCAAEGCTTEVACGETFCQPCKEDIMGRDARE